MVTKDYSKSRMRENRTYGSVRGGQSNLIPSTRLTAALPLRVVEGASKFIEDAGLYKTFTTALRAKEIPLWWLVPPPFRPAGKRVTGFSVAYGSLRIQFPCHRKRGHYGCLAMEPCLCRKA